MQLHLSLDPARISATGLHFCQRFFIARLSHSWCLPDSRPCRPFLVLGTWTRLRKSSSDSQLVLWKCFFLVTAPIISESLLTSSPRRKKRSVTKTGRANRPLHLTCYLSQHLFVFNLNLIIISLYKHFLDLVLSKHLRLHGEKFVRMKSKKSWL